MMIEALLNMSASVEAAEGAQKEDKHDEQGQAQLPESMQRLRLRSWRWPGSWCVLPGTALTGPGGLLRALTKTVIETALDEEMADHRGYDKHDPVGRNTGNSSNGTPTTTVLTDNCGPVEGRGATGPGGKLRSGGS